MSSRQPAGPTNGKQKFPLVFARGMVALFVGKFDVAIPSGGQLCDVHRIIRIRRADEFEAVEVLEVVLVQLVAAEDVA